MKLDCNIINRVNRNKNSECHQPYHQAVNGLGSVAKQTNLNYLIVPPIIIPDFAFVYTLIVYKQFADCFALYRYYRGEPTSDWQYKRFIYSPTDILVSCLKNSIKIYIKIYVKTASTCLCVTVTQSSGSALIRAY